MRRLPALAFLLFLAMQPATRADAAEIRLFCTQALRTSLLELAPRFEKATGHKITMEVAPSGQLVKRVESGEHADVLIANADNIDALLKSGKATGQRIDIARAQVGIAVKAGTPKPDISTPDAVKRAFEKSRVAYSAGGLSGNAFESVLQKLGILEDVKSRAKFGSPAAKFVVSGEADLAVQQIPELIAVDGAELVGALPPELDQVTQFSMGVLAAAGDAALAKSLIDFLRAPDAQTVIRAKGLTPG